MPLVFWTIHCNFGSGLKKQFSTQFVLAVLLDFLVMRSTLVHHRFKKIMQHNTQPSELAALSVGEIRLTSALRFSRQRRSSIEKRRQPKWLCSLCVFPPWRRKCWPTTLPRGSLHAWPWLTPTLTTWTNPACLQPTLSDSNMCIMNNAISNLSLCKYFCVKIVVDSM